MCVKVFISEKDGAMIIIIAIMNIIYTFKNRLTKCFAWFNLNFRTTRGK